jgi:hypothetical protein
MISKYRVYSADERVIWRFGQIRHMRMSKKERSVWSNEFGTFRQVCRWLALDLSYDETVELKSVISKVYPNVTEFTVSSALMPFLPVFFELGGTLEDFKVIARESDLKTFYPRDFTGFMLLKGDFQEKGWRIPTVDYTDNINKIANLGINYHEYKFLKAIQKPQGTPNAKVFNKVVDRLKETGYGPMNPENNKGEVS